MLSAALLAVTATQVLIPVLIVILVVILIFAFAM